MDVARFDAAVRSLSRACSRRGVLGIITALTVATADSLLGDEQVAAKRARHGRRASHRPGQSKKRRQKRRENDNVGAGSPICAGNLDHKCQRVSDGQIMIWDCRSVELPLDGNYLSNCSLIGGRFQGVSMKKVLMEKTVANNSHFDNANLASAHLNNSSFVQVTFPQANLTGVQAEAADMRQAVFTGANLRNANLHSARLDEAIFQNADLRGVNWENAVCPDGHRVLPPFYSSCCGHLNGYTTPWCDS